MAGPHQVDFSTCLWEKGPRGVPRGRELLAEKGEQRKPACHLTYLAQTSNHDLNRQDPRMYITEARAKEFWSYVIRVEGDGCWNWTGTSGDNGVGKFLIGGRQEGKRINANRIAWVLEYSEPLPSHYLLRRTCKNFRCVCPQHMRLLKKELTAKQQQSGKYYVLRPPTRPPESIGDPPKRKSHLEHVLPSKTHVGGKPNFEQYMSDIAELKQVLHGVVETVVKLREGVLELARMVTQLRDTSGAQSGHLSSLVDHLTTLIADTSSLKEKSSAHADQLAELCTSHEDLLSAIGRIDISMMSQAPVSPESKLPLSTTQQEELADSLLRAVGRVADVRIEPTAENRAAVMTVFEFAVTQCDGDNQRAAELFGDWIDNYQRSLVNSPAVDNRSAIAFAESVMRTDVGQIIQQRSSA